MPYKGQTAVLLSIFLLVGMMFLVPAITEKALAYIKADVTGTCGIKGQTHPCKFTIVSKEISEGSFVTAPYTYNGGTSVGWATTAFETLGNGDEKGSVTLKAEGEHYPVVLSFENPLMGFNKCAVSAEGKSPSPYEFWVPKVGSSDEPCKAGKGYYADFAYDLRVGGEGP